MLKAMTPKNFHFFEYRLESIGFMYRYPCAANAGNRRATIKTMIKGTKEMTSNPSNNVAIAKRIKPHTTLKILDQMAVRYTLPPQVKLIVGVVRALSVTALTSFWLDLRRKRRSTATRSIRNQNWNLPVEQRTKEATNSRILSYHLEWLSP